MSAVPQNGRTPVVWIINMGGHNYKPAEVLGRLMPLTKGNVNHFNLDRLMVSIAPKMDMATVEDYLLVSGTPILNGLIISMWLTKFGKANLLQWSQQQNKYVCIPLHRDAIERMVTAA
jgi:hypothetical protein